MTQPFYVGIDIAQATFDVALWPSAPGVVLGQFPNTPAGYEQFAAQLAPQTPAGALVHLVLEPTGGYELGLLAYAYHCDWAVCLPNPKTVRDWAKGSGRRAKTDRQDSLLLAHYGVAQQPPPQDELPPALQQLADLLARRRDLQQLRRSESNRLASYRQRPQPLATVVSSLERTLETLDRELALLEQALKAHIDSDPQLKADVKRLRKVPGVGAKNVLPLLLILYRWRARTRGRGSVKGLVAFLGLDPQPFESGRSVHKRATVSRMGDRTVRSLLYMGALGGVRGKNPLREFYQRLVGRGKAKKLALVAAARKILVWAWHVFTHQVDFDATRYSQTPAAAS